MCVCSFFKLHILFLKNVSKTGQNRFIDCNRTDNDNQKKLMCCEKSGKVLKRLLQEGLVARNEWEIE